jgi:hypothetical protein
MSDCGITHSGLVIGISTTVENDDVDLSTVEGLSYENLPSVGNAGDTGVTQNIINYSTLDRQVICKGKGEANAGDPTIEALDVPSAALDLFVAAAATDNSDNYVIRYQWPDGSYEYNRGLITGPQRMKGGNEDFKRIMFTCGNQQAPIVVEAPSA